MYLLAVSLDVATTRLNLGVVWGSDCLSSDESPKLTEVMLRACYNSIKPSISTPRFRPVKATPRSCVVYAAATDRNEDV